MVITVHEALSVINLTWVVYFDGGVGFRMLLVDHLSADLLGQHLETDSSG